MDEETITFLLRRDWYDDACHYLGICLEKTEHSERFYEVTLPVEEWRMMNDYLMELHKHDLLPEQ